ncbi:hypothetical protein N9242_03200 [Vicingaceae bacterium]|nr:hypothetical protein [Vicingaceae bacterium]
MNLSFILRSWLVTCFFVAVVGVESFAQTTESFEGRKISWQLRETDCQLSSSSNNWKQERSSDEKHGGLTSEHITVRPGRGSKILVTHNVQPSFVIPELKPEVWIKANHANIRLLARVVFPRTTAPDGEGPMTALVQGAAYKAVGSWKKLGFENLEKGLPSLVKEQLWLLRTKYGRHVDGGEAFIDMLVLDLFTGDEEINVWIDDLTIQGSVSARNVAAKASNSGKNIRRDYNVRPVSGSSTQDEKPVALSIIDGNVIEVRNRPFFARIIQHNGEPFELLKQIGFNTIELKSAATFEQLQRAEQLDVWLVCPPPVDVGLQAIGFEYDRVLAWSAGRHLTARDAENVRQTIREIKKSDGRSNRPIVGQVESDWSEFGRICNIISVGVNPMGGSFVLSQYSEWLIQRQQLAGRMVPMWASVQTQSTASTVSQVAALGNRAPPAPIEPDQLKFMVYEALSGGARGLRFQSRTRLDATDLVTRLRALTLKWINVHLNQLEPWGAGGALMGKLPLADRTLEVTALQTDRSRLLLVQRPTHLEQWSAGSGAMSRVAFADTGGSTSNRAYWLAETGLIPMPLSQTAGGSQVEFERCPAVASVVLTEDAAVISKLSRSYLAADGTQQSQLYADIVRNWLAIVQVVDRQLINAGHQNATASGALREAVSFVEKGSSLVTANSTISGNELFTRANQRLAVARRQFIQEAKAPFRSHVASPLINHCSFTPVHWELAGRMSNLTWRPNALAGGDFENLPHMLKNGWRQRRIEQPNISALVELSSDGKHSGKLGLKLTARNTINTTTTHVVETTPVWISTAPVRVNQGQLVRIHGWIKIPNPIKGSLDGLMIIDSLGGPDLAERIHRTSDWQEFCLYRGVPNDSDMTVTFALTGLGTVLMDEVTVRTMDLPAQMTRQATAVGGTSRE